MIRRINLTPMTQNNLALNVHLLMICTMIVPVKAEFHFNPIPFTAYV